MDKESIIKSFISCREKLREVAINIKDLPEDDEKGALEEIQSLTNKKISLIEEVAAAKNKELMSI